MVKGFSKMNNFSCFWTNFFCKHFYYITEFCDEKLNFCKFANIFADSKIRAQELSNDVTFVIFGYKTWDLDPSPPSISWFSSTPAGKWYYRVQLNLTNNATQGNLAFVG